MVDKSKVLVQQFVFGALLTMVLFFPLVAEAQSSKVDQAKLSLPRSDNDTSAAVAVLQGLNKITAKSSEFEVRVGSQFEFGKLNILVHKCWQAPLDQRPESKILIEVYETNNENIKSRIFYGWLFASSPSISGLEHPIYDIIALGCKYK